jgi:hypothetical protein
MLRSVHGHDPEKGKAPDPATAHGVAPRAAARAGLRPVQHWVPDLRDPQVLADIRRQVKMMARHPENDAIDDSIESVYDWDSWK